VLNSALEEAYKPWRLAPHYEVTIKNKFKAGISKDNMLMSYEKRFNLNEYIKYL
jgi:hypothetical protein